MMWPFLAEVRLTIATREPGTKRGSGAALRFRCRSAIQPTVTATAAPNHGYSPFDEVDAVVDVQGVGLEKPVEQLKKPGGE
jgi:hypothetical protein